MRGGSKPQVRELLVSLYSLHIYFHAKPSSYFSYCFSGKARSATDSRPCVVTKESNEFDPQRFSNGQAGGYLNVASDGVHLGCFRS
jgi:hypothetical protein